MIQGDIKTRRARIEKYWENKATKLTTDNLKLRTVETHLTTTSIKRPPHLKDTFWPEQNFPPYFMFNFASLIRLVSY